MGELRPLTCDLGCLSRPDGSATLTQGDTSVTAAVYGPTEVKIAKELIDKSYVEVVYKQKSGLPSCAEKFNERIIRNTCQTAILASLHPRTAINITIQELQNSGSLLSCCINAACLCLLDCSISMGCMVAAVCVGIDGEGGVIVDPNDKQEKDCSTYVTFVFESKKKEIVSVSMEGSCSSEQFKTCLSVGRSASEKIFKFYRDSIEKKMSKSLAFK
ncbi:exosome complex component RRP46-like [Gigantopelta aegis]|uniref:exosome complex component RRP46-like n=1 Tax=Gigantopelta aegis TaxID=1735272 RepID=UPI001B88AD07|nr:exosome complex component RRP46-like [Gigantopelta aegis]XP_041363341.1 exosome complex component RRP46-like [Gigantopelta aegis]XP_041363342.1 exosome complex component RRP46-like [Gigantopelta aegis]XP_041363343.1 exosome complex component RRP46-like [Gigantopelta aegis]